jgi:hypothetical protein
VSVKWTSTGVVHGWLPARSQRFDRPAPVADVAVRLSRARFPSSAHGPIRKVGAGACNEIFARQSVVGMVVGEKNRYIRISAPGALDVAARRRF